MKTLHDHLLDALAGDLYPSLHGWARRRAQMLRHACDVASYAEDLVQDALVDTLGGTLAWDPVRIPLVHHLRRAIRCQSRHDLHHARRFPRVALDPAKEPAVDAGDHDLVEHASEVTHALRELAASDPEVLLLLDALEHEVYRRAAMLEWTGLSLRAYKAARARLARLRSRLPTPLLRGSALEKRVRTQRRRP